MHEYSIVGSLIEQVTAVARANGASAVHGLRVRIGELAGVNPGLLATAYDTFRAGTPCEAARLVIEEVPALWTCPRCGAAIARGSPLRCPDCAQPARLVQGDEIILARVEMEVP